MSFTVDDFQDLLRLLDQHPEWQAELRRKLLTEELLGLPALVRELAAAQARTEQRLEGLTARVEELAAAQARTEQRLEGLTARVEELAAAQARTEQRLEELAGRVDALAEAQARTERRLGELLIAQEVLASQVKALDDRVGRLDGEVLELRYERRAFAYLSALARRLRVLGPSRLADLLDDAVQEGRLTEAERHDVLLADLVLTGRRYEDQTEVYLVVEVSAGVGLDDVHRVVDRAAILAKLGRPVVPVVAGRSIVTEAGELAPARGVWQVVDGHAIPPG